MSILHHEFNFARTVHLPENRPHSLGTQHDPSTALVIDEPSGWPGSQQVMTPEDNLTTTQGAAIVALLLLLLVPVAVALAVWFKRRYAQAVVQLQASTAPPTCFVEPAKLPCTADSQVNARRKPPLRQTVTAADAFEVLGADPTRPARRLRARVLMVQFVSGLLYWWTLLLVLALALAYLAQVTGQELSSDGSTSESVLHLVLWPLLVMPAALAWAFQAGVRETRVWTVSAVLMALFGLGLALSGMGWWVSVVFIVVCALLAFMLAAFMRPAVRGAGPPLVAAFTVGLLVFSGLLWVGVVLDTSPDEALTAMDWFWGLSTLALMMIVAGFAAWRMLMRLARRYNDKCFSEQQLALGAYWALITSFTLALVLLLSFEQRTAYSMEWLGLAILIFWLVWRWLQRAVLWLARRGAPEPLGGLLLLRVFKPSERSEAFTDRFLARWRFAGPVWMIAGPDLAGAYMEPDEFFAYLRRRLHERFITDPASLPDKLAQMDNARDPDGRFRVNELFCANTTWQTAVLALIDKAGVVLLDLREYTHQRAGTRFELGELLRRATLHKVLVLVSAKDDAAQIQSEIEAVWQEVGAEAAAGVPVPCLQLLSLGEGTDAEMLGLFRAAARAACMPGQTDIPF